MMQQCFNKPNEGKMSNHSLAFFWKIKSHTWPTKPSFAFYDLNFKVLNFEPCSLLDILNSSRKEWTLDEASSGYLHRRIIAENLLKYVIGGRLTKSAHSNVEKKPGSYCLATVSCYKSLRQTWIKAQCSNVLYLYKTLVIIQRFLWNKCAWKIKDRTRIAVPWCLNSTARQFSSYSQSTNQWSKTLPSFYWPEPTLLQEQRTCNWARWHGSRHQSFMRSACSCDNVTMACLRADKTNPKRKRRSAPSGNTATQL